MKESFENAQKKEKERYQNDMMALQNQFAHPDRVALFDRDSNFIRLYKHAKPIQDLPFAFFMDGQYSAESPMYERQETLYEKDGKLYVVYKQINK
jgi:hypothetical protein